MALSNATGALVLTTGNKSELAVGYCTLYGDMCGGLAVISDVPKTLVYESGAGGQPQTSTTRSLKLYSPNLRRPNSGRIRRTPIHFRVRCAGPYLEAYVEEYRPAHAIAAEVGVPYRSWSATSSTRSTGTNTSGNRPLRA